MLLLFYNAFNFLGHDIAKEIPLTRSWRNDKAYHRQYTGAGT